MLSRRLWSLLVVCGCALAFAPSGGAARLRCTSGSTDPACKADISMSVTPPSGTVYVGQDVVFTVTVTNAGPYFTDGGGVSLLATPGAIRLSSPIRKSGCVRTCNFTFGKLTAGQQTTAQFHLRPVAAGTTTLKADYSARPSDPSPANDSASASVNAVIGKCTSGIPGSAGNDRIFGTVGGEVVNALAGNDLIRVSDGDDCVNGGAGDDTIAGGGGADLLKGGPGADTISGGPGLDKIAGGPGPDRINAADGERDSVSCGPGKDSVKADRIDTLHGCERVRFAT